MRIRTAAVLGLACIALSGCAAAPPEPDPGAVQAWLDDVPPDAPAELATVAGKAGPGISDAGEEDEPGGIIVEFPSPVTIDRIEITCFGEATIAIEAEITGSSTTTGAEAGELHCAAGPQVLIEDGVARNVTRVRVNATDANVLTAWRAAVHGSDG